MTDVISITLHPLTEQHYKNALNTIDLMCNKKHKPIPEMVAEPMRDYCKGCIEYFDPAGDFEPYERNGFDWRNTAIYFNWHSKFILGHWRKLNGIFHKWPHPVPYKEFQHLINAAERLHVNLIKTIKTTAVELPAPIIRTLPDDSPFCWSMRYYGRFQDALTCYGICAHCYKGFRNA